MQLLKLLRIFLFTFFLFNCGFSIKEPRFKSNSQQSLNPDWKIELIDLGFYRKVGQDWWGEDFYAVKMRITNLGFSPVSFDLCPIYYKYIANPGGAPKILLNQTGFTEFEFRVKVENPGKDITDSKYEGKQLFPKVPKSDNLYKAAMVGCFYGVPMSRDTDDSTSSAKSLLKNQSDEIITIFSLPKGAVPVELFQNGYFKAVLNR